MDAMNAGTGKGIVFAQAGHAPTGTAATLRGATRRVWPALPALALSLVLCMVPAAGRSHAQDPAARLGCRRACWARAFLRGHGERIRKLHKQSPSGPEIYDDHTTVDYQLRSNTAFTIDNNDFTASAAEAATFDAKLHGHLTSYKNADTFQTPGCTPRTGMDTMTVPAPLQGEVYVEGGHVAVSVDFPYPAEADAPGLERTWSAYTCGTREIAADHTTIAWPTYPSQLYWPLDPHPLPLEPAVPMPPGERMVYATLHYHVPASLRLGQYETVDTLDYKGTVEVLVDLCPDQNLRHNCNIPGLPPLPKPHK